MDYEYKLYDEWNKDIFNENNKFFLFLFYLPIKNIEEKDSDFIIKELKEFSTKYNTKQQLSIFIINDYKDIFGNKILNDNLLKSFITPLITIQE